MCVLLLSCFFIDFINLMDALLNSTDPMLLFKLLGHYAKCTNASKLHSNWLQNDWHSFFRFHVADELAFPLLLRGLTTTDSWINLRRSEVPKKSERPPLTPQDLLLSGNYLLYYSFLQCSAYFQHRVPIAIFELRPDSESLWKALAYEQIRFGLEPS